MTKRTNWKYLISPSVKALIGYVLVLLILFYNVGYEPISMVLFVSSFTFAYMFLFYMAPILILYFTHKKSIRGKSITWNGEKLVVKNRNMNFVWPDDFSEIEMYQTISAYHNRFDWSLWGHYGYYLLKNEQGQQISLSFLLTEGLNTDIWKNNITRKKKIFPIPLKDLGFKEVE